MSEAVVPEVKVPAGTEAHDAGPLNETQREALAHMVVAGLPPHTIAKALNRSISSVKRFLASDDIQSKIEDLQARVLRQLATHHASLMEMLEDCRAVYRDALRGGDPRLRFDVARHIEARLVPGQAQRTETHVTLEGQVNHEVAGSLKAIAGHVVELRKAAETLAPGLSIRSGIEALATPQIQVIQVEDEVDGA